MSTFAPLYDFLDSEDNQHGLDHITTHGFLCATIVGPALKDWSALLFEDQQNTLPEGILASLEQWRDELINELKEKEKLSLPFFFDDQDDNELELTVDSDVGDWCAGFIDAMSANEENNWFDKAQSVDSDEDEIASLTLPMVIFSGIEEEDEDLLGMRTDPDIMLELAEAITDNLSELYLIFQMPK